MEIAKCFQSSFLAFGGFYNNPISFLLIFCCRIFLSLMEVAGLTELLKTDGGFTLFAPSDEAFAGLSDRDVKLLKSRCWFCFHQLQLLALPVYNHVN